MKPRKSKLAEIKERLAEAEQSDRAYDLSQNQKISEH